jgi:uncharacterized protein (DUF885 family)
VERAQEPMGRGSFVRPQRPLFVRVLLAVFIAAHLACTGKDARVPWPDLRERYFIGFLKRNPITATYLGGDGTSAELADINAALPDVSKEGRADEIAFYRSILADLERVDAASLSPDDAIDREVVRAQIRFMLRLLVDLRHDQKSIDTYLVAPFRGVDWQIQQMAELPGGGRGTAEEWDRVTRRVLAVPAFLRAVQAALQEGIQAGNVPDHRMVQYDGIDAARGHAGYFAEALPKQAAGLLKGQTYAEDVVKRLSTAGREAADAFRGIGSFLAEAYRPFGGSDRFACGASEYDWRLLNNLRLSPSLTAAALFEASQSKVVESQDLLIEVAKQVATRRRLGLAWANRAVALRSARAVMDDLSRDYPKSDEEMFGLFRRKATDLVEYARRHDMFDLPSEYRLEIVATPPMLESTLEAAYYPAPAFKPSGIGRFYLTASHGDVGVLKENNIHSVADLCAHEGFPGHDWQYQFMRQRQASIGKVRWLTPGGVEDSSSMWEDSMSAEGWALYAEQLVGEPQPDAPGGFYTPEERLYQLKWQTLRDARVRIDTGLHTGRMSFDEAVAYYLDNVEFLPDACAGDGKDPVKAAACNGARRAIYRYSKWPTQAITYHLGKRDILELRDEIRRLRGDRFSLRDFHERFLSAGTIPAGYFRDRLLEESAKP